MSINFEILSDDDKSARLLDYVKGRLGEDECAEIERIAAKTPAVAEEVAYYQGLARAVAVDMEDDTPPGELGWARLAREIEAEESVSAAAPIAANDNGRWWRYAAIALGLVVSGQMAMQFMPSAQDEEARYVQVTQQSTNTMIQVTFLPQTTEEDIRKLLLEAGANIVSGPSALGIYELGFADQSKRDAELVRLQDATGIVETALAH